MRTLHIRNVPEEVYETLRVQAKATGRSLNSQVLDILGEFAEHRRLHESIAERLRRRALRISLPSDAPKPEDLIRANRDSR